MQFVRQRRSAPGIDMSPLIDCVFQLLIFFMLSSSMLTPQIDMTLPQAATEDEAENPELAITVSKEGEFFVNSELVRREDLKERLIPLLSAAKKKVVTFAGDEKMPYEHFVWALDAARQAGAEHVDVAHQGMQKQGQVKK